MINIIVPLLVVIIIIYGIYKKVDIFDTFLLGVKEGLKVSINLFPTIFAMVIAITMLTNSNLILDISNILGGVLNKIKSLNYDVYSSTKSDVEYILLPVGNLHFYFQTSNF